MKRQINAFCHLSLAFLDIYLLNSLCVVLRACKIEFSLAAILK
jgi:hypothetical protein